jgi:cation diffusion facilitator family transporter
MFMGAVIFRMGATLILVNYKGAAEWSRNVGPERRKIFAAQLSVFSNSVLVAGKLIVGTITGSISIIAEGIHSSLDLVAALIANYSVKRSSLPADKEHKFGHGKFENVSALIEGMLIFFAAYLILNEVYKKLQWTGVHLKVVDLGIGIMLLATVANILISKYLFKVAKETGSAALEADALHLRTDVYTSAGVLFGLFLIRIINRPGFEIIDPIFAVITALIITHAAYELCRDAIYNLIDTSLPPEEEKKIIEVISQNTNQTLGFHTLRTRKAGNQNHIDLRLVIPKNMNVEEANVLVEKIGHGIEQCMANVNLIIQVEPCLENCGKCEIKCVHAKQEGNESVSQVIPVTEMPKA